MMDSLIPARGAQDFFGIADRMACDSRLWPWDDKHFLRDRQFENLL